VFQFITAIVFWVIMIVVVFYAVFLAKPGKDLAGAVTAAVLLGVLGFGLYAWGGVKSIPLKNIGVPSALGNVGSSVYQHGTYETWQPWESFTNIDETVQSVTWVSGPKNNGINCDGGLAIRIGGQQSACANVTIQFQVRPLAAISLLEDYANHGPLIPEIKQAVVIREFETVVNQVLGDYDPITDQQNVSDAKVTTSQFTQFAPTILAMMRKDIGDKIIVQAVYLPKVLFDPTIENALNSIQQAHAEYAVQTENELVNAAKAKAIANLGTPTLAQLIAQCLQDSQGKNPGNCIPGSVTKLQLQNVPGGS
jgi:hypothetical protein